MGTPEHGSPRGLALRSWDRRPLEDRIVVRFPRLGRRLAAWLTPLALRMPRRWRLRRWLLEWAAWRVNNAFRRGDLELLRVLWHPNCIWESHFEGLVGASVYHGHDGLATFVAEWAEAWGEGGGWSEQISIEEFGGGVFLADERLRGTGRGSGAAVELEIFQVRRASRRPLLAHRELHRPRASRRGGAGA